MRSAARSAIAIVGAPRLVPEMRSAKALGVLAVVGMVVAFSLSSTLVKRAESPGVLVAFWRMIAVSVVWNACSSEHRPADHDAATCARRSCPGSSSA